MKTKELKITPPKGYCIDIENSTFECIKFKKKQLTYEDIARNLFKDKYYCIEHNGSILKNGNVVIIPTYSNVGTSIKQLEKLLAINKLMNVAKYLNGDWKPDWDDRNELKFCIIIKSNLLLTYCNMWGSTGEIYFKSKELAQQAIDILGEDTIRLALSTDW